MVTGVVATRRASIRHVVSRLVTDLYQEEIHLSLGPLFPVGLDQQVVIRVEVFALKRASSIECHVEKFIVFPVKHWGIRAP